MDNERGWDPDVKKFLLKVLNSISLGLLWLMACATAGIYYGLAYGKPLIYTILFYVLMLASLVLLTRYLLKIWKKEE
jgi:FtsH-binding integral membrane protein